MQAQWQKLFSEIIADNVIETKINQKQISHSQQVLNNVNYFLNHR